MNKETTKDQPKEKIQDMVATLPDKTQKEKKKSADDGFAAVEIMVGDMVLFFDHKDADPIPATVRSIRGNGKALNLFLHDNYTRETEGVKHYSDPSRRLEDGGFWVRHPVTTAVRLLTKVDNLWLLEAAAKKDLNIAEVLGMADLNADEANRRGE